MRPRIAITSSAFIYTPAVATDIRATFQRERARLAEQAAQKHQVESLLTRRIHNIFDARRREAEAQQAVIRG